MRDMSNNSADSTESRIQALEDEVRLLREALNMALEWRHPEVDETNPASGIEIEIIPAEKKSSPEAWEAMIKEWEENPLPDD